MFGYRSRVEPERRVTTVKYFIVFVQYSSSKQKTTAHNTRNTAILNIIFFFPPFICVRPLVAYTALTVMEHWSSHLLTVVIDRSSNLFVPVPTSVYASCRNVYFYWFFFSFFEDMSDEMKLLQGPESNPGGMLTVRVWADSYCCPFNPGFHSPLILWALSGVCWCLPPYLVARTIFLRALVSFGSLCCLAKCSPTALLGNSVSQV